MKNYLSSRERVAVALSHREPDKVPIALGVGRARTMYAEPYFKTAEILGLGPLEAITSRRNALDEFDERFLEALNIDFRYQLTVIGVFAQAIVKEKINNNQFVIQTDQPNVEVSWQVTGIRNDEYARDHRLQTEVDKPDSERGKLLYSSID